MIVTVGGEENPRGLSDLCLTHNGFYNQGLVRVEGAARPNVQARKLSLGRAKATKGEMETWMLTPGAVVAPEQLLGAVPSGG